MDLFEILFILLFVLFPIMEQVLKRRRGSGDESDAEPPERSGRPEPGRQGQRQERAEEMVPDDLWAVLTGERRPAGGVDTEESDEPVRAEETAPWSSAPEPMEPETPEEEWWPEPAEPESRPVEVGAPAPGSREYRGPEAYSLETLDYPATSLERPIPSPQARHRAFHERYDRPAPRRSRPRPRSALSQALGDARSVRQAFVLTEILGPPKGLQ